MGVFGLDRFFHRIDEGLELLDFGRRDVFGEPAADEFVHGRAQVEDLDGLVDGNVAHEDAAVFLGAHQAGLFKHAEGLAHRAARDAHFFGQRGLYQFAAGLVFAGQDGPLDFLLHHCGERLFWSCAMVGCKAAFMP